MTGTDEAPLTNVTVGFPRRWSRPISTRELEFETDHHSGQLRHPKGGPYLFIAERPPTQPLQIVPAVAVTDAAQFSPPSSAKVVHPFEQQHWPALQMMLEDPDGRQVGVDAPLPRRSSAAL